MHCSNCGKDIPDDSRFCPYCSEAFKGEKAKKGEKKDTSSGKAEAAATTQTVHVYAQSPQQEYERAPTPIGVMLIAILVFISGLIAVLGGILTIPFILTLIGGIVTLTDIIWIFIALLPLLFGLLYLWIGLGLWNLRRSALNWYLGLFLFSFILSFIQIYLYWYNYDWIWYSSFVDYIGVYLQVYPYELAGFVLGWIVFFYLVAVRSKFNGYVPKKTR